MELLEKAKKELETLDARSLRVIYENAKLLNAKKPSTKKQKSVASLDEIWKLSSSDKTSWADELARDRE